MANPWRSRCRCLSRSFRREKNRKRIRREIVAQIARDFWHKSWSVGHAAGNAPISRHPILSFAAKFCARFQVPLESFESEMMRRTLYAPGRWVWRMGGASSAFFWPDQDFIRGVALLKSLPEFELEMRAFTLPPMNGRFHRD